VLRHAKGSVRKAIRQFRRRGELPGDHLGGKGWVEKALDVPFLLHRFNQMDKKY
jgi:hypothetical protein